MATINSGYGLPLCHLPRHQQQMHSATDLFSVLFKQAELEALVQL